MANQCLHFEAKRLMRKLKDEDTIEYALDKLLKRGMPPSVIIQTGLVQRVCELRKDPVHRRKAEKILKEWKEDLARFPPSSPSSSSSSSACSSSSTTVSNYRRKSESFKHAGNSGTFARGSSGALKRKAADRSGESSVKRTLVEEIGNKPVWSNYRIPKASESKLKLPSLLGIPFVPLTNSKETTKRHKDNRTAAKSKKELEKRSNISFSASRPRK